MPVKWEDKYVKCPFYCRTDTLRIVCEGLEEKSKINLTFELPEDKSRYMHSFCYGVLECRDCPIHSMLNSKYEETG